MRTIAPESARMFESALGIRPAVAAASPAASVGVFGWKTSALEGFELPASGDLVIALHLGGSRTVREVRGPDLSPDCSVPGLLTVLPPGRPAAFSTRGPVSLISLHIPRSVPFVTHPDAVFARRDPRARAAMRGLLQAARSDPRRVDRLAALLLRYLSGDRADAAAAVPELRRRAFEEMLSYAAMHLGQDLSLDALAARAGLGRTALVREFRSVTGLSPHQYLDRLRIERAQTLLATSECDLAFIAQELGFSSQSHFTLNFRARTGCSPARFRAAVRSRDGNRTDAPES